VDDYFITVVYGENVLSEFDMTGFNIFKTDKCVRVNFSLLLVYKVLIDNIIYVYILLFCVERK